MGASHISGPLQVGAGSVVLSQEVAYVEDGEGTYTGTVALPAGATLLDIIVYATALWDAATSALMDVGDVDPNGFYAAINLKATDLLAGESVSFANAGGKGGAYFIGSLTHIGARYSATARDITGIIVSTGAGTAGRTRMTVVYSLPVTVLDAVVT